MKTTALRLVTVGVALLLCLTALGEVDMLLDVRPGTLILSAETGDFQVYGPHPTLPLREVEEAGEMTTFPNVKAGVGISSASSFLDLTGNLGVLVNERFRTIMYGADVSYEHRFRKNVAMGPHLGLVLFPDPEWTGDADVTMDGSSGWLAGFQISIGYDVLFVVNIDYLFADPFEVDVAPPWEPSGDELDISGFALQFGIRGRL